MMSSLWSLLLCLVLICGLNRTSVISYISLHETHIIIITICVYCNFNILIGIYQPKTEPATADNGLNITAVS